MKAPIIAWLYLAISIITEVLGSSYLKIAQTTSYGFLVTAIFICISYYFIALAVTHMSVSVAYAMWEVLGVVCIMLIGIWYFDEHLQYMQYVGIFCAIVGIICINIGESNPNHHAISQHKGLHLTHLAHTMHTSSHATSLAPSSTSSFTSSHHTPSRISVLIFALGLIGVVALAMLAYMYNPALLGFFLVCVAGVIDVIANLALKASKGFSHIGYGICAVVMVLIAFYLLMLALDSMELAVAYSSWGAIGIIGTAAGGRILFAERLTYVGYVGIALVIIAVGLLHGML